MAMSCKMSWLLLAVLCAAAVVADQSPSGGAPVKADISEEGVQKALKFAVAEYNKGNNDVFFSKPVRVIDVKKQVVEGMKYIITVEMGRTACRKGTEGNLEVCAIYNDPQLAKTKRCTFEVWSRPWLSDMRMVKNTCQK
ncbi:CYT protein, partial [Atractosteus spatula]|nr:CYT protein [Atractosteus spatula]